MIAPDGVDHAVMGPGCCGQPGKVLEVAPQGLLTELLRLDRADDSGKSTADKYPHGRPADAGEPTENERRKCRVADRVEVDERVSHRPYSSHAGAAPGEGLLAVAVARVPPPGFQRLDPRPELPVLLGQVTPDGAQAGVAFPPVDADLPRLVNRGDQQPNLDREQLDVEEVHADVTGDDDAVVEHALEDVREVGRLLPMIGRRPGSTREGHAAGGHRRASHAA